MTDTRTYIKVHDGMPDHPKIEPLSDKAFRLLIELWCWCSRQLTDGLVPSAIWAKRASPKVRRELLDAGLVVTTDDGVEMHDYRDHQRSKAEVLAVREARQEAGKRGGQASAKARRESSKSPSKIQPVSETDTETEKPPSPPSVEEIDGSWNGGGGEASSMLKTRNQVAETLIDEGYSSEELAPGLQLLEQRFKAGEQDRITSPYGYVKYFADNARVAAAAKVPNRYEIDGVLMEHRDGAWVEVES